MSVLGRMLNMLLDEGFNALTSILAVANLDRMMMVAQMNACTLSGVIVVDEEEFGVTWCDTFGRFLTNSAH